MVPVRTLLVAFATCVLAACSGGGQQITPASSTATTATTSAGSATQSGSRATGTQSERRGRGGDHGGGSDHGDRDDNGGKSVYNSIPKPVSSFISSLGFECCQVQEFGDGLKLTHTGRLGSVSVVMDSWGCQAGHWNTLDCVSAPNATFTHPITVNVYAANTSGPAPAVGPLLATQTRTFAIPYRPSADNVRCTGTKQGRFFSTVDQKCVNGLANVISYDLSSAHVNLPANIIVSVAYNTSTSGYTPIGTATACFLSAGGCGYDSLNVSADGNGGPVGSVLDPNGVFISYSVVTNYCEPSQGGGFRLDTSTDPLCSWAGFHPQIKVTVGNGDGDDRDRGRDRD
jgi:hypothetical protein